MRNYLQAASVLAVEAVLKPSWAYYHLRGHIQERYLLRLHPPERVGREKLMAPEEALAAALGADKATVAACMNDAAPANPPARDSRAGVIPKNFDASEELCLIVYCATRLRRPHMVVEVGVGRGATSSAILSAMRENGQGHLYSIEFPSLRFGYADGVGALVLQELRSRWTLIWGPSAAALPKLLEKSSPVDLFVHDGAHTYHNQLADYSKVVPRLAPGAVVVFDDVNNDSFLEVSEASGLQWYLVRQRKQDPAGIAVKAAPRTMNAL